MSERHCPHCQTALPDEGVGPTGVIVCPGCQENVDVEEAEAHTVRIPGEQLDAGGSAAPAPAIDATEVIAGTPPADLGSAAPRPPEGAGGNGPEPSLILDSAILDVPGAKAGAPAAGKAKSKTGGKKQRSSTAGTRPSTAGGTGGRSRESLVDPLVGTSVGGCQILNLLGRGAMGSVYRARQVSLDRIVALKTIREDFCSDEQFLNRFRQEARTVGRFNTPYVVQIHEVGYDEGVHFIVMEFVSGGNLLSLVKDRESKRLTVEEALRFMHETCEGMLESERLEIVHRDIKPENLLLDTSHHIKIADFGIAKVLGATIQMTASPAVLGTPLYMSPEQARGEDLDHRSDMYSVGATYYHLLTGVPPVRGESVYDLLQRKNEIDYLSPGQILKDESIPDPISRIIEKMTALHTEHRYESFGEVLEDLERVGAGKEVRARTPPRVRPRKSRLPFVATLVFLALVSGGIWGVYNYLQGEAAKDLENPPVVNPADLGPGTTPRVVTPLAPPPFREREHRAELERLDKKVEESPSFALIEEVAELRTTVERDRDRFDDEARPEKAAPLLEEIAALSATAVERAVEAARRGLEESRLKLENGPDLPLLTKLQRDCDAIPRDLAAADELRQKCDELIRCGDNAQSLKKALADLDIEELDSYASPYTDAVQHWGRVRKITSPTGMELCPEVLKWLAAESVHRAQRLTGKLTAAVDQQVAAAQELLERAGANEVAAESIESAIESLERSRQNLVAAAFTEEATLWTSRISDELIQELRAVVTKRDSMAQEMGQMTTLAQGLLERLRSARSLDEWRPLMASIQDDLDRLNAYSEAAGKPGGAELPSSLRGAIESLLKLDSQWRVHEMLVVRALGHLASGTFRSPAATTDREALRRNPMQDEFARTVDQVWTAIEGAIQALLVELDLGKATDLLADARNRAKVLAAVEGESPVAPVARRVGEFCTSCQGRLDTLGAMVQDMAPVPGDEVELPGSSSPTQVAGFFLDRTEVSVDAYRGFLAYLEGKTFEQVKDLWPDASAFARFGEAPRYLRQGPIEKAWPIEEVNYHQAMAFLRWQNPAKDLPTYAEWWLAARGDARAARSRPLPISKAEIHRNSAGREPVAVDVGGKVLGFNRVTVRHLAGNVWEWSKAEPGETTSRLLGGSYRPGEKDEYFSGEETRVRPLTEGLRSYGFRGVIRVRDFFADLLPKD